MENYTKKMIEIFYMTLGNEEEHESMTMKISTAANISDVTMIDAIAAKFGTTRTSIVSDILHNAVSEMYAALTLEDKTVLSEVADLETTRILTKNGVTMEYVGMGIPKGEVSNQDHTWRTSVALIQYQANEGEK